MSVVLDSGVWISGFHFRGIPLLALDVALVSDRIVICPDIVLEVSTVLTEKFGWSAADVNSALAAYLTQAIVVELKGEVKAVCRDPKDDMLFECALLGDAEYIVSGDKDVLDVGSYHNIRALTARQYLSLRS